MTWLFRGLLALLLTLALLLALALQANPSLPPLARTTPTDARALKTLVERNDPRRLILVRPPFLAVNDGDLNLLLAVLAQQRPGVAARADLQDRRLRLRLSLPLAGLWLNAQADLIQGAGWPELDGVRLGHLPLPAGLSRWLLLAWLDRQHALDPLRALRVLAEQVRFQPGRLLVLLRWQPDSVERLLNGLWPPIERERALVYSQALIALGSSRPAGAPIALSEVLQKLFALAEQRSAAGHDPAAENRMALLTLAVNTTGRGWTRLLPAAKAWPPTAPLELRLVGREDFPLHWLYSAAITVAAGSPLSDVVGLDKELSDAHGGSGFSFNDLAADRAGTRLGQAALSRPGQVQRLLARPHTDALLMPPWEDLPEFLTEADFQRRYGGPQAAPYRRMMATIEARLDAMPLFRP
jgi:hypothetical protein